MKVTPDDVWPPTDTVTLNGPAVPAGSTALHDVVDEQFTDVAAVAPKFTVVAPGVVEKPLPVSVT